MDDSVHWLENVDSNPRLFKTACGSHKWVDTDATRLLDTWREAEYKVTCRECLKMLACDTPVVISSRV